LAATRNRTIELSRGEYIAFLDHDDLWEPEKLEIQTNMLEQDSSTAFVYSNCYLIEADGSRFGNYFETWDNTPFSGHILEPLLTRGCFIPLPSVMIRKKVLVEVGGFNTGYRFVEDYDIWLRIAARHRVDFVDKALCSYRVHDKMTSKTHDEVLFKELLDLLGWWSHQPDLLPHVKLTLAERCCDSLLSLVGILKQRGRKTEMARICARAFWNGPRGLIWRTTMKGMGRVLSKIGKNFTPSRPGLRD
jgi:glycosyltransferase involved in cell wall biosynthesis